MKKLILAILFLASPAWATPHIYKERIYQRVWCKAHNGRVEVELQDKTRVDCLTETYAVEVDFASKWAEAVGQSMHYSAMTGKQPAIVLIIEKPAEKRFLRRLQKEFYWIRVFTIGPADIK